MRVHLTVLVTALGLLVSCAGGTEPGARPREERPPSSTDSTPSNEMGERGPLTRPDEVLVDNQGIGKHKSRISRAIADLKVVGMWKRLTKELFVVELSARPGRDFIPEDAHLADAYRTLDIRGEHAGVLCDITFYPRAMLDDLDRWRSYFERGLMAEPPPTVRQLWAAILAHELSHCLKRDNDEDSAQAWERRALRAVRAAGLD